MAMVCPNCGSTNEQNLQCQDCGVRTFYAARFDGDSYAYDMAHIKSRGAGGSDVIENVKTKCHECHMREHQKPSTAGE